MNIVWNTAQINIKTTSITGLLLNFTLLKSKLVVAKPHQKMLTDFSELEIDINCCFTMSGIQTHNISGDRH
jgi:hypothetical protein